MDHNYQMVVDWITNKLSEILKVTPDKIDLSEPFSNYGMDSISAVTLSGDLEDWLGKRISATIVYDYPNIKSLAEHLSEHHFSRGE